MSRLLSHMHARRSSRKPHSEHLDKRARDESPDDSARPPEIIEMEQRFFEESKKKKANPDVSQNEDANPDVSQNEDANPKVSKTKGAKSKVSKKAGANLIGVAAISGGRHQVAKKIVDQVRAKLNTMSRGTKDQDCSVCFVLRGRKAVDHLSGNKCPFNLCGEDDEVWKDFKHSLVYRSGYLCYNCLLPTVCLSIRLLTFVALTSPDSPRTPTPPGRHITPATPAPSDISSVPPSTHSGSTRSPTCEISSPRESAVSGRAWRTTSPGAPPATEPTTCPTTSSCSGAS